MSKEAEVRNRAWEQIDPEKDREEWLDQRKLVLGASEIMATAGLHPYMTPQDLQERKLGLAPRQEQTAVMRRGKLLEPVAVQLWEEETGKTTIPAPMRAHPDHPIIAATADRLVVEDRTPLEAKCLGYATFQRVRRAGLTDYIIGQVQIQAFVWDTDGTHLAVMHPDSLATLPFEVELDRDFVDHLVGHAEDWWQRHILDREPVEDTAPAGSDELRMKLPDVKGQIILRDDKAFVEAMADLMDARDIRDEAGQLYKDAQDRLVGVIGEDALGVWETPDGRYRVYRSAQRGRAQYSKAFKVVAGMELFDAEGNRVDVNQFLTRGDDFVTLRPYRLRAEEG